jgi:uncharacterized membrane protein
VKPSDAEGSLRRMTAFGSSKSRAVDVQAVGSPRSEVGWLILMMACYGVLIVFTLGEVAGLTPSGPARVLYAALGVPGIFLGPGAAWVGALWGREAAPEFYERLLVACVLSFALVLGAGLCLSYLFLGVTPISLAGSLCVVEGVGFVISTFRLRPYLAPVRVRLADGDGPHSTYLHPTMLVVSACVVFAAVGAAVYAAEFNHTGERFTAFAVSYKTAAPRAIPFTVNGPTLPLELSLQNRLGRSATYEVQGVVKGETEFWLRSGFVADGASWHRPVTISVPRSSRPVRLEIRLFLEGRQGSYRDLHLWLQRSAR